MQLSCGPQANNRYENPHHNARLLDTPREALSIFIVCGHFSDCALSKSLQSKSRVCYSGRNSDLTIRIYSDSSLHVYMLYLLVFDSQESCIWYYSISVASQPYLASFRSPPHSSQPLSKRRPQSCVAGSSAEFSVATFQAWSEIGLGKF